MTVKELVKDAKVKFLYYRKGELWYEVWKFDSFGDYNKPIYYPSDFTFPVPTADCGDGQFNAEDKAMLFMRYIRKHLDTINAAKNDG